MRFKSLSCVPWRSQTRNNTYRRILDGDDYRRVRVPESETACNRFLRFRVYPPTSCDARTPGEHKKKIVFGRAREANARGPQKRACVIIITIRYACEYYYYYYHCGALGLFRAARHPFITARRGAAIGEEEEKKRWLRNLFFPRYYRRHYYYYYYIYYFIRHLFFFFLSSTKPVVVGHRRRRAARRVCTEHTHEEYILILLLLCVRTYIPTPTRAVVSILFTSSGARARSVRSRRTTAARAAHGAYIMLLSRRRHRHLRPSARGGWL